MNSWSFAQSYVKQSAWLARAAHVSANIAIAALWLWLYRPVYGYLGIIFSRQDFRTNQIVLAGVVVLIAFQVRKGQLRLRLNVLPQLYVPALVLALGGSALFLIVERFLDVNTISASLLGLASYGLLGLWMQPRRWREGLPAALLLIGALPFGEHMQTFIGYPMRILTAGIVRDGLAAAGVASVGIDTILVLENGVSQVDLPCSGVKSLWTGALFLIAATWIERRPLNLHWFLTAAVSAGLLFAANVARVGVLVVVGQVAGWTLAARMLHVPLGVLGFGAVCAAAVGLLRWGLSTDSGSRLNGWATPSRPLWLAPALAAAILAMALVYAPRPQTGLAQPSLAWTFPSDFVTQPAPLRPDELAWFTRDGADSAERWQFEWRGVTGSMMFVTSKTWRAQHRPERCFEVYGLSVDDSSAYLVAADFPVRVVSLSGKGRGAYSAAYWFQSASRITDDYGARMWADLAVERERWVLVTITFDGVYPPDSRAENIQALYTAVRSVVQRGLEQ